MTKDLIQIRYTPPPGHKHISHIRIDPAQTTFNNDHPSSTLLVVDLFTSVHTRSMRVLRNFMFAAKRAVQSTGHTASFLTCFVPSEL
jgi:hypothetical protein